MKRLKITKPKSSKGRNGINLGPAARQINNYDKIFRENMEAALPGLIERLLVIYPIESEELPDDIQHTKERKPDVLKKIKDTFGETFVLHIEFQVTDEKEMPYRMAEYYIMLLRRYRLPIRQFVFYLGEGTPKMADRIFTVNMRFNYSLFAFSDIDYRLLLKGDNPEEKMYAILGNFGNDDPHDVVKKIVSGVTSTSQGSFSNLRHIEQLRILSQLRKLAPVNRAIMENLHKWFKEDKDPLYELGETKGIGKGQAKKTREFVKALLLNTNHTVPEIARLVNVSETFVRKVKKSLQG